MPIDMKIALIVSAIGIAFLLNLSRDIDPYMDEIFHIPQAQRICSGDFNSYDPKITTPPGLYILSLLMYRTVGLFSGGIQCSTIFLRGTNGVISLMILPILYFLRLELYPPLKGKRRVEGVQNTSGKNLEINRLHILHSLTIFMYPVGAFFYTLYYTDSAALLLLLLTYYISILEMRQEWFISASTSLLCVASKVALFLSASLAILVRQTNAVWIMFIFGENSTLLMRIIFLIPSPV